MLRYQAGRGAQADDAAERRRRAQAPAEIGALGERHHARGERRRAAAGRAGSRQRRVPRIARRAEHLVDGVGPRAELGRVGLAEHDRARRLQPHDDLGVFGGHVILEQRRAPGGADARGRREVLDPDRNPVQGTELPALADRALGLARPPERLFRRDRAEGVDLGVEPLDRGKVRLRHLEGARLLRADQPRELSGGKVGEFGRHGHAGQCYSAFAPERRMISPHFALSARTKAANSSGAITRGSMPRVSMRLKTSGRASAREARSFSRWTM